MKIEDIPFGDAQTLWLKVENDSEVKKLQILKEVSLYSNSEDFYTLEQSDIVLTVKGKDNRSHTALKETCNLNIPRIVWIEKLDNKRNEVLVNIRKFVGRRLELSKLDIAIDDKILEQAKKQRRSNKTVKDVVEWLSSECLVASEKVYTFLSAGKDKIKEDNVDSFVILGQHIRLNIKRTLRKENNDEIYLINKLVKGKPHKIKYPVTLASGDINFTDYTVAGKAKMVAKAALDELIKDESSYLDLWNKFSGMERKLLLNEIENVGSIDYSHLEYEGELVRFDVSSPILLQSLSEGKQLEISSYIPSEESFSEYLEKLLESNKESSGHNKEKKNKVFYGEIKKLTTSSIYMKSLSDELPPQKGKLMLSMRGDITRLKRQNDAWEKIRYAKSSMPHLGLILEGAKELPTARNNPVPALNAKIKKKIFPKNPPTKRQEEAIKIALNTPDIALIQGPPGTGKTTVITAIVERLNEILDTSQGVGGEILITAFQHDAVENAIGRMSVNNLPAMKFGKKSEQDEDAFTITEQKAHEWSDDIVKKVRLSLPDIKEYREIKDIKALVQSYLLSPVDGQMLIDMLHRILDNGVNKISSEISERIRNQIDLLQSDEDILETSLYDTLISSIRDIRTYEISFKDDGPEMAYIAIRALQKANLEKYITSTLQDASNWFPGDELNFLEDLLDTKNYILSKLIQTPKFQLSKVNKDVAELLMDIVDNLENDVPKSKSEKILSDFVAEIENNPEAIRRIIISYTTVYGATNQYTASKEMSRYSSTDEHFYDSVIVDEAARSAPLDLLIPLVKAKKRIILVGDHRQLPHIIDTALEKELENELQMNDVNINFRVNEIIKESLFSYMFKLLKDREEIDGIKRTVTLDSQFRSHPLLGEFISDNFYEPYHEGFMSPLPADFFDHSLDTYKGIACAWIDVPISKGAEEPGMSKTRVVEAKVIAKELAKLLQDNASEKLNFGVITFYKKQVDMIARELASFGIMTRMESGSYEPSDQYRELVLEDGHREEKLRIGTVDAFQGKEFDVVFLSMVRSNNLPSGNEKDIKRKFGHLMSPNRMCVSMSRQKKLLIVVGDGKMLESDREENPILPLKNYYNLCKSRGIVINE